MTGQTPSASSIQSIYIVSNQTQSDDKQGQKSKFNSHSVTWENIPFDIPYDIILAIMTHASIQTVLNLSSVCKQDRSMLQLKFPLLMSRKAKNIFNQFAKCLDPIKYQNACEVLKRSDLPPSRLGVGASAQDIYNETRSLIISGLCSVDPFGFSDIDSKSLKFEDFPDVLPLAKPLSQMKAFLGFFEQILEDNGDLEKTLNSIKSCSPKQQKIFNLFCIDWICTAFITQEGFLKSNGNQNKCNLSKIVLRRLSREKSQSAVVNVIFEFIDHHCKERNFNVVIHLLQKLGNDVFSLRLKAEREPEETQYAIMSMWTEVKTMFLAEFLASKVDVVKQFGDYIKNNIKQLNYCTQVFFRLVINCHTSSLSLASGFDNILPSVIEKVKNIVQAPDTPENNLIGIVAMGHWRYFYASLCHNYNKKVVDLDFTKKIEILLLHGFLSSVTQPPTLKDELISQYNDIFFDIFDKSPEIIKSLMEGSEQSFNCCFFLQCMRKEIMKQLIDNNYHKIVLIIKVISKFLFSHKEQEQLLEQLSQSWKIVAFFQNQLDSTEEQLDPDTEKFFKMVIERYLSKKLNQIQ